jgi:hypothetical protein
MLQSHLQHVQSLMRMGVLAHLWPGRSGNGDPHFTTALLSCEQPEALKPTAARCAGLQIA